MEYDQEFEKFWVKYDDGPVFKSIAYAAWQAAKSPKPEKKIVELEGGEWPISGDLKIFKHETRPAYRNVGHERKTEADAMKAAELMRKRDRLAAYVYEHCGYEGEPTSKCDHYIYTDCDGEYFHVPEEHGLYDLSKQYMPESTAIWLCEKLNSGEIVL